MKPLAKWETNFERDYGVLFFPLALSMSFDTMPHGHTKVSKVIQYVISTQSKAWVLQSH